MDFEQTIQEIKILQEKLQRTLTAASRTEDELKEKLKSVVTVCRPACDEAVQEYNASASLCIVQRSLCISFLPNEKKICLSADLTYTNGREPDEDLDFDDIKYIEHALKMSLDRKFQVIGIPVTFGSLSVPVGYYGK